ncbi:Oxoglutarate iron-dependent dioxygenase protein [Rutstroemia sp. NJR-2017a BBW]|nr:Oxoglutarate iron-dependent dioxygenase protein [Rutstroemia sp. NJR-2017a BBW]
MPGGALLVSHRDHTNTFDWSAASTVDSEASTSPAQIKWAAFYSDCTHEVQPVVTGHRVTLTYNLYVSPRSVGSIFTLPPPIDAASYPLAAGVREMLSQNGFMPEGGKLGFFCTHQYAHASGSKGRTRTPKGLSDEGPFSTKDTADIEQLMPYALKGVDAMIFQIFASLGVNVTVKPMLDNRIFWNYFNWNADEFVEEEEDTFEGETRSQKMNRIVQKGYIPRIGKKFWGMQFTNREYGEDFPTPHEMTDKLWPSEDMLDVTWLNDAKAAGWQPSFMYVVHGNGASADWTYSHATILIDIPPRNERLVDIPESGFLVDGTKYERDSEGSPSRYSYDAKSESSE